MRQPALLFGLKRLAFFFVLLFLTGCGSAAHTISLENKSDESLKIVGVYANGEQLWTGTVGYGKSHEITFKPKGDGTLKVVWVWDGGVHESDPSGTYSVGAALTHRYTLNNDGSISYRADP